MNVIKSDGSKEYVNPFTIVRRLRNVSDGLPCDLKLVCKKACRCMFETVTSSQLAELLAEAAADMAADHPHYDSLATRIVVSELNKNTKESFSETIKDLYESGQVADDVYSIIMEHAAKLDGEIIYARDREYDYVGIRALERSYLLKIEGKVVERPQHMLMRVAVGIHKYDIDSVIETYQLTSQRWFTHASPTLLNAGTPTPQLSSSLMVCLKENSNEGFRDAIKKCDLISNSGGGISVSIHNIQSTGSCVDGTIPSMHTFNYTAEEGGRRKSALAVYLEPWHADIFEYLDLRTKNAMFWEEQKAQDLVYALWVPDLFMERVESRDTWSLFCPTEAPGLADCYGENFKNLYTRYEKEGKAKKQVDARTLWDEILMSQIETGIPSLLFKGSSNRKSNQQNLGTIKSSNLSAELIEFTSPAESAMCNLASIALPQFVRNKGALKGSQPSQLVGSIGSENREFDFDQLAKITSIVTKNLNKTIDVSYCPVDSAKMSNRMHRPIGIGVQGLADTFILLGMPYYSAQAKKLNEDIFETIYYHSLKASSELAEKEGPYETYDGSPVSKGILQQNMWESIPLPSPSPSGRCDWEKLRGIIEKNGVRNSLLVTLMPTDLTTQILGCCECFAPYTSNIQSHRIVRALIPVVNKHLLHDLTQRGVWSSTLKNQIICKDGSVQEIPEISQELQNIYKTVWEIDQKILVEMAADRGRYIDQSQSLNIHMMHPTLQKLSDLHFYAWRKGLKTGMYRLRSRPAVLYA